MATTAAAVEFPGDLFNRYRGCGNYPNPPKPRTTAGPISSNKNGLKAASLLVFDNRDDATTRRLIVAKTALCAVSSRRRAVAVIKNNWALAQSIAFQNQN